MTKVIVSGGCSFAYGYRLEDRDKKYSSLIANEIGVKLIDVAVSGAANENIAPCIAYGLNQALAAFNPKDIIVMVGWTELNRIEYYNKHISRLQTCFTTGIPPSHGEKPANDERRKWSIHDFVIANMWEPCYSYYKLLHAFNYVHSLCELRGVRVIHLKNLDQVKARMAPGEIHSGAMRSENYTNGVLSNSYVQSFNDMFESVSFIEFLRRHMRGKKRKYTPEDLLYKPNFDHHPTEIAHRIWAKEIFRRHQHILLS